MKYKQITISLLVIFFCKILITEHNEINLTRKSQHRGQIFLSEVFKFKKKNTFNITRELHFYPQDSCEDVLSTKQDFKSKLTTLWKTRNRNIITEYKEIDVEKMGFQIACVKQKSCFIACLTSYKIE